MDIKTALALIVAGKDLEIEEMRGAMRQIMTGEADDAQIGGFLTGLRVKGETVAEITGAVEVMRELVTPVSVDNDDIVDIVGTGGTGMNVFNVSTAASFVVAALRVGASPSMEIGLLVAKAVRQTCFRPLGSSSIYRQAK